MRARRRRAVGQCVLSRLVRWDLECYMRLLGTSADSSERLAVGLLGDAYTFEGLNLGLSLSGSFLIRFLAPTTDSTAP